MLNESAPRIRTDVQVMFFDTDCAAVVPSTFTLAVAVKPVPPSVDVIAPVVLTCRPAVVPVTFTEKVQDVVAARVAPVSVIRFVPAAAVIVPPPQVPLNPGGVETTRPPGSVSLNPIPVNPDAVLPF